MRTGNGGASGTWNEIGRVLLVAALLLAVAGCATTGGGATKATAPARDAVAAVPAAGPTYNNGGQPNPDDPYRFVIAFDAKGCPVSATPDLANCPNGQPACLRVKGGQTVRFQSTPEGTEYMISFDPFRKTWMPSSGGTITVEAAMHGTNKAKPHTFLVTAASGCETPLDPQIILD